MSRLHCPAPHSAARIWLLVCNLLNQFDFRHWPGRPLRVQSVREVAYSFGIGGYANDLEIR